MYLIETMEKCDRFLEKFRANGWHVWQMQFQWYAAEGFHAWFMKAGEQDIEIVTYNEEVQKAIVGFNGQKSSPSAN